MMVEFRICDFDEFLFGINSGSGEDEYGEFYIFSIGFLLFEINFIKYYE